MCRGCCANQTRKMSGQLAVEDEFGVIVVTAVVVVGMWLRGCSANQTRLGGGG